MTETPRKPKTEFAAGDRVRFVKEYSPWPKGFETSVRSVDEDGHPILKIDPPGDDYGWSPDLLEKMVFDPAQWSKYQADFNAMSDSAVDTETRRAHEIVDDHESWIEAVAAWDKAGRPRTQRASEKKEENQ